jgi:type 1 glutamine amidotransferase
MFLKGAASAALLASPLTQWASAQETKTRKVLFFTRSQGFEHDAIHRFDGPDKLSYGEQFLVDFGKNHNMEVTCTKDGAIFTPDGLAPFDVIMFYTTGNLEQAKPGNQNPRDNSKPMPPDGKQTLLKAISDGKGFLGIHSATDTWDHSSGVDPYVAMIGGQFVTHKQQEKCKILAVDHDWAPAKGLEDFEMWEEWYILQNLAPDMHVLLVQDTKSMKQTEYNQRPIYPETWARMHGKGRVFYTSMGHRSGVDEQKDKGHHGNVWATEIFQKVLLGGLQWTSGNIEADVTPNIAKVAPDAPRRPAGPA